MKRRRDQAMSLIALLLLGVLSVVFVSLGRWQLRRADERTAIAAQIEAQRNAPALFLSAATPTEELQPWRPAIAQGRWLPQLSVLIDNRNQEGRPGLWLATPLVLSDGHAVLVLRGWFERVMQGGLAPPASSTAEAIARQLEQSINDGSEQVITGELSVHVPRLFELWQFSGAANDAAVPQGWANRPDTDKKDLTLESLPKLQNLELLAYQRLTGLTLLPTVLMQTDKKNDGLSRSWPRPSLDADKNNGYALQWFGFATIALIAWVVIAYKAFRRRKAQAQIGDNS